MVFNDLNSKLISQTSTSGAISPATALQTDQAGKQTDKQIDKYRQVNRETNTDRRTDGSTDVRTDRQTTQLQVNQAAQIPKTQIIHPVSSLYTVIPNGEGLLALKHFFDLRTVN